MVIGSENIPFLLDVIPKMKCIHVMRNGLDMAYSLNQTQVGLWGGLILGCDCTVITPKVSLKYWVKTHKRLFDLRDKFPGRIICINYDELCQNSQIGIAQIERFLGLDLAQQIIHDLRSMPIKWESVGRYKNHSFSAFDNAGLHFMSEPGFYIEGIPFRPCAGG